MRWFFCLVVVSACSVDEDAVDADSPDTHAFTDLGCAEGTACDDGDPCTTDDRCDAAGACAGTPLECDDGLACTADQCLAGECESLATDGWCVHGDPAECVEEGAAPSAQPCLVCTGGLLQPSSDAPPCDDGDVCTLDDVCVGATCAPIGVMECPEDGNPCTDDFCSPTQGCVSEAHLEPCDDADPCTVGDQCQDGQCVPGQIAACDDGDPCTNDGCTPDEGCVYEPSDLCDDGDPCTEDLCNAGSCTNPAFTGPCEDGDPCTVGEECFAGVCSGGQPNDCDDNNVCTADQCAEGVGCTHFFVGGSCSDGFFCTKGDKCVAGLCLGDKNNCPDCPLPQTDHALKVVSLLVSADGNVGSALDIDGDPSTCAPAGNCSGGADNALAVLSGLLNGPLQQSIDQGSIMYVTDFSAATFGGQPFPFSVLDAKQTEASKAAHCDFQLEACEYQSTQFSFDAACNPYFGLPDGKIAGGTFTGGGEGAVMTIGLALSSQVFIPITMVNARVQGVVTLDETGTKAVQATGIFGGAVPKAQLIATIASLPEELLPVDKDAVIQLLSQVVINDIDLDQDGTDDAASVALRFQTIPATLTVQ